jgi:endonuclease III
MKAEPAYVRTLLAHLKKMYPRAKIELTYKNPFELVAATILSAQCTDRVVNQVTPGLFRRFPTPAALARAEQSELEGLIHATGFFRNKAKSLRGMAEKLVADFGGEVPPSMVELLTLPGVARKTANVVLGGAFSKAEGVVVDTHVKRLAARLGLTRESAPEKIERDLMALVPRREWIRFGHWLIWHGRRVCFARRPDCGQCALNKTCPSAFEV